MALSETYCVIKLEIREVISLERIFGPDLVLYIQHIDEFLVLCNERGPFLGKTLVFFMQ
jgi:hypothetical protein